MARSIQLSEKTEMREKLSMVSSAANGYEEDQGGQTFSSGVDDGRRFRILIKVIPGQSGTFWNNPRGDPG